MQFEVDVCSALSWGLNRAPLPDKTNCIERVCLAWMVRGWHFWSRLLWAKEVTRCFSPPSGCESSNAWLTQIQIARNRLSLTEIDWSWLRSNQNGWKPHENLGSNHWNCQELSSEILHGRSGQATPQRSLSVFWGPPSHHKTFGSVKVQEMELLENVSKRAMGKITFLYFPTSDKFGRKQKRPLVFRSMIFMRMDSDEFVCVFPKFLE